MLKNTGHTHSYIFGSLSYCFKLKVNIHSPILRRLSLIKLYCKLLYHALLEMVGISEITGSTLSLLRSRSQGQELGNLHNFTQLELQIKTMLSMHTPPQPGLIPLSQDAQSLNGKSGEQYVREAWRVLRLGQEEQRTLRTSSLLQQREV